MKKYIYHKNRLIKKISIDPCGDLVDHDLEIVENLQFDNDSNRILILSKINNQIKINYGLYAFYNLNTLEIVCISPKIVDEYLNDNNIGQCFIEFTPTIENILNGKESLFNYTIEKIDGLSIVKKKEGINCFWKLSEIDKLDKYKGSIGSVNIKIKYSRRTQTIEFDFTDIGILSEIDFYFSLKNDKTLLVNSLKLNPTSSIYKINDFFLPFDCEIYSPTSKKINIKFEEFND